MGLHFLKGVISSALSSHRWDTRDLVLFALFTALIAIGAFIRIPVPFCPFTLQLLFTMLAGLLLGSRRGAASVAVYVFLGLIGLPVFTSGGGPSYIFQPTFGYLLGFIGGLVIVYACGMVYLALINNVYLGTPISLWTLFVYCFVLPIPGDIFLCIVAAFLARRVQRTIAA